MKAILLLEDVTVFHGKAAGKTGTTTGEICFNTGMTGYQEIFTDPSYTGQVLVATNVHIGNYGIKNDEIESESIKIAGFICRNFNIPYSRQTADRTIQDYLEQFLGEHQFSVVTALAKQVNVNLNERLQSLEDIVKQIDAGLLGRLAALPSHGARPDAGLGGRLAA